MDCKIEIIEKNATKMLFKTRHLIFKWSIHVAYPFQVLNPWCKYRALMEGADNVVLGNPTAIYFCVVFCAGNYVNIWASM